LSPRQWDHIAGRVDDAVAELLVLHGELVNDADQGRDVGAELSSRFLLSIVARSLEMVARSCVSSSKRTAAFFDALVELVFDVGVPLGKGVAGHVGFLGEGNHSEGAVASLGGSGEDPVHGGADPFAFVGCCGHSGSSFERWVASSVMVIRVLSRVSA
jgi:hypothetical protein